MKKTLVIAHRGASAYAPENTIPAFKKALEIGADGIELDVHLSKDGYLVVTHDENIERTSNGKGFIKNFRLQELKEIDFGSWFGEKFKGTTISTLEEVMELISDWNGVLNIEIKGGVWYYLGIEKKCLDIIKKYHFEEKVIFSSFNHYSLRKIKKMNPDIKIGLLYFENLYNPWNYAKEVGAEALHPYFPTINDKIVSICRQNNIVLNPWTVDSKEDIKKIIRYGADGLITNKPDVALHIRDLQLGGEIF